MIKSIPLNKLIASPRNVRRSTDPNADMELKSDIEARGLLQNLVVTNVSKPRGCFAVEAGERRRSALQSLADEGRLSPTHEVCCLVVGGEDALEASLAENFQRLAMNPADECLAFQKLVDQGSDAEAIARRFGLTVRFVEGRLRLARLAPVIFDALGAGEITLDVAKAYAASADRERQSYVFEQVGRSYMGNHPESIRRMMTEATVSARDRRALFVGEDAYVEAGGRVERDLFRDEADARFLDVALLERLALERMEMLAGEIAAEQGFAFVRPILDSWVGCSATEGLRRIALETQPLTDEESSRVDALEAELEEIIGMLEGEEIGEAERSEAEARIRELGGAISAIIHKPPVIDEQLAGHIGTFLLLDNDGRPKLDRSFYTDVAEDEGSGQPGAPQVAGAAADGPARAAGLPRRLVDELAMQRRDILAVHVAADPAFALDLAIFLMVDRSDRYSSEKSGSSLCASRPSDPVVNFETPGARATLAALEAAERLDRSWTSLNSRAERFDAFRSLGDDARAAWLGHALARTLEASARLPGERACAFHDHLGGLLGIDVARWWRPTGANYFDRVPKNVTLEALKAVGGPSLASPYAKAKKTELAQAAERIFAGDFIADCEVKRAALKWLPEPMRFAANVETDRPLDQAGDSADGGFSGVPEERLEEVGQAA
jgi:ParB family chromosome partitioning protein